MLQQFLFIFSLLAVIEVSAQRIEATFSVEFGIFGQVAEAKVTLDKKKDRYTLDATVHTIGKLARTATDNLQERHISKGRIDKEGFLVTYMYQMIKHFGDYKSNTLYRVDHKKKELHRLYQKWKNNKPIVNQSMILGYYARDDLMTLFLNLTKHIPKKQQAKTYHFDVVGADRKYGRVDVQIPTKRTRKMMQSLIGSLDPDTWYSRLIMHRKLYGSKQGELDIRMGSGGFLEEGVLKDLIFFGDVRIIRTSLKRLDHQDLKLLTPLK